MFLDEFNKDIDVVGNKKGVGDTRHETTSTKDFDKAIMSCACWGSTAHNKTEDIKEIRVADTKKQE